MLKKIKELKELQKSKKISTKELAERMADLKLPLLLGKLSRLTTSGIISLIWIIPSVVTLTLIHFLFELDDNRQYFGYAFVPLVFILLFISTAGFFGQIGKYGIIEGKFPRTPEHPIYALRRVFGAAWTQVFYFKPLYSIALGIPTIKKFMFRIFGYRGNLDFVVYPDCWLRDLPLLKINKGAYLANRSTIGTNICLDDGSILVGSIEFAENSMLGHLAVIALGTKVGKKSMIGTGCILGIRTFVGDNVDIGPRSRINHGSTILDGCKLLPGVTMGLKSKVGANVTVPECALIPSGVTVENQQECDELFKKEKNNLENHKDNVIRILEEYMQNGYSARAH